MKYQLIIFTLLCFQVSYAQNVKRGFKNLEKKEYEKSKEVFQKILADDNSNVAANLGMALVLADDSSSVFNIIDSWQYAEKVKKNIEALSQDDIDVLTEYFLNTEVKKTSRPTKKKVEIALNAIEARLIKYIREENNLEAVYEVLTKYPNFKHYDNVIHIRNQFEFRKYEKMNTLEGYQEFIKKFPDAAQIDKANKYIFNLSFEKAKSLNTVEAYNEYIKNFPSSELLQTALKLRNAAAYADVKKANTFHTYEQFIEEYPDALEVADARVNIQNLLYEQAKRIKSMDAYNDFIKRYPEGKLFIDIFNLKAADLGEQAVQKYGLHAPSVQWARGFDDNGKIESDGVITVNNQGEYILACNSRANDTSSSDVWVIKIDKLGKILWNKYIGQPFEDRVSKILLDSKGDILVLGYTWLSSDSASKMGWMFKLGSDGKKLWNKNLGKISFQSAAIDQNDRIYLGGTFLDDSLGFNNYMLNIYNNEARKVFERVFTGQGIINDLSINQNGDILIAGSNWFSMLDSRRYLLWDDTLKSSLKTAICIQTSDGGLFAGAGKESVFYAKYLNSGKKAWFTEYPTSDSLQIPVGISVINPNLYAIAEQKTSGAKIKYLSPDGKVNKVAELIGDIKINSIVSYENAIGIIADDGNILIFKLNPESSF